MSDVEDRVQGLWQGIEDPWEPAEDTSRWMLLMLHHVRARYAAVEIGNVFIAPFATATELVYPLPTTPSEMRKRARQATIEEQRDLAARFAERAAAIEPAAAIWATYEPDFVVSVVSDAHDDLDRELALHAIFVELTRQLEDPGAGDLIVRSANDPEHDLGERVA